MTTREGDLEVVLSCFSGEPVVHLMRRRGKASADWMGNQGRGKEELRRRGLGDAGFDSFWPYS